MSELDDTSAPSIDGSRIEWRNVPESWIDTVFLLFSGVLVWGGTIALLVMSVRGVARGDGGAWIGVGFGLMFALIGTGLTIWYWPVPSQRIVLDFDHGEASFENLRPYDRFWPQSRIERASCALDDILTVRQSRSRAGSYLIIRTRVGRFIIHSCSTNFLQLRVALEMIVGRRER